MRSRVAEWFETKVRYEKQMDDGQQKTVTEAYVVDALNFTEAENTITEEMKSYIIGEFKVSSISKSAYKEVIFSDNPRDDRWYKVKIQLIIIDEKTEKEKLSAVNFLVQSNTLQNAVKNIEDVMNRGLQDWRFASVVETNLIDVFEHTTPIHADEPGEVEQAEQA